MSENRRIFPREFKIAPVKLVTEKGRSVAEAARSLGISTELLRRWKIRLQTEGQEAFPVQGKLWLAKNELRRLRAWIARLGAAGPLPNSLIEEEFRVICMDQGH